MIARDAAERVAREEYGRLLAFLAARSGDVHAAEDALSEAFAAALVAWPRDGVPRVPAAWLLTAARRKLLDGVRHAQRGALVDERLALAARDAQRAFDARAEVPDERLGLLFACAHPAIAENVRAPLMLQTIVGLDAERIASAFLVAPSAMGQRLVRAKRKIATAGIPLRLPVEAQLAERLAAVLDALYATYTAGWNDDADVAVRGLDEEATYLARFVVGELPDAPEALGLLALMRFCSSRRGARRDDGGAFVPLAQQDPGRWDAAAIAEGESLLRRASTFGQIGRYQLEAAVQSAHSVRVWGGSVDWKAIVALYDALLQAAPTIVVRINRAVALAQTDGAVEALEALDDIADDPRIVSYQPYWAARAAVLERLGDPRAVDAYGRAIGLCADPAVRAFLQQRAAACAR